MKMLVIGIDGLEYDLVEKFNLENLKQEEYSKVKVPLSEGEIYPHTPEVWGSFLTGNHFKKQFKYSTSFLNILPFLAKMKNKFIKKRTGIGKFILDLFSKTSIDMSKSFPKLEQKTFMEHCNSDYCNIPFFDFSEKFAGKISPITKKFKKGQVSYQEYKSFVKNMYTTTKKRMFEKLKNTNSDLFFGYFYYLDLLQHHFFKDKELIKNAYKEVDKTVKKLIDLSKADFVLIISDHGSKNGKHTKHGFYSFNKKIGLDFPYITDFYDIIMENMNFPTREEESEVEKHLKELGYF